jgi:hypothetical protein
LSIIYIRFSAQQPGDLPRAPLLEHLLVHATATFSADDWRREAFRLLAVDAAAVPPVAAAALQAVAPATPPAWVCVASPLHLVAGMSNVTLSAEGLLNLDEAEAQQLAMDHRHVFSGSGSSLVVGRNGLLLSVFDRSLDVKLSDPEQVLGHDVYEYQPTGADAAQMRASMSEIEMWLHEHAVNRARSARGLPAVTGLWLWGGGPILSAPPAVRGWTVGHDPLFEVLGNVTEFPSADLVGSGAGIVVTAERPGSAGWPAFEARWLGPAAEALSAGVIDSIELSAGERRFRLRKGMRWRVWRRARPWWESLQGNGSNGIQ